MKEMGNALTAMTGNKVGLPSWVHGACCWPCGAGEVGSGAMMLMTPFRDVDAEPVQSKQNIV